MLAHLAGNSREYDVRAVIQLHFEKCVGLLIDNRALRRNQIFSCQWVSPLSYLFLIVFDHASL